MNNSNYAQAYYWYYATRDEALNWPIAPGNMLVFKDPDGRHYYEKSLGWSPYEGVTFKEFKFDEPVQQKPVAEVPNEQKTEVESRKDDICDLKSQIAELVKLQSVKPYYKKGDNKNGSAGSV